MTDNRETKRRLLILLRSLIDAVDDAADAMEDGNPALCQQCLSTAQTAMNLANDLAKDLKGHQPR